jgi:hypothetical protein
MIEFLRYIRDVEYLVYFILGALAIWQLRAWKRKALRLVLTGRLPC